MIAVVELGMSLNDFMNSTPYDISRYYYSKTINNTIHNIELRDVVMNGYYNVNRGKKDKFLPLNSYEDKVTTRGGKKKKSRETMLKEIAEMEEIMKMFEPSK